MDEDITCLPVVAIILSAIVISVLLSKKFERSRFDDI